MFCLLFACYIALVGTLTVNASGGYTGKGYMFTYNVNTLPEYFSKYGVSTRDHAARSLPWLWKMFYDTGEYLNNSVEPLYSILPNASIFVISTHGAPGMVECPDPHSNFAPRYTYLTAKDYIGAPVFYKAIDKAPSLKKMNLAIFAGCQTGSTHKDYGNLIGSTMGRGAKCAMGWVADIPNDLTAVWLGVFFQECFNSKASVNNAAAYATWFVDGFYTHTPEEIEALGCYATANGDQLIYFA